MVFRILKRRKKSIQGLDDYEIVDGKPWWVVALEGKEFPSDPDEMYEEIEKITKIGLRLVDDYDYRRKVFEEIVKRGYDPEKLLEELERREESWLKGKGKRGSLYEDLLRTVIRYFIELEEIREEEEAFKRQSVESEEEKEELEEFIKQRKFINETGFQALIVGIINTASNFIPLIEQLRSLKRMGMME